MNTMCTSTRSINNKLSSGFTLIELIIAIIVSSILAVGTVSFITRTVEGAASTSSRNQLASAGRTAIDRISFELHNALPNSIRSSPVTAGGDQCIEFIPVNAATTYLDPSFSGTGTASFDVVNFIESGSAIYPASPPSLYAVISPVNTSELYDGDNGAVGTWPSFPNRWPIQRVSDANPIVANGAEKTTITLGPDPGPSPHRFRRRSITDRFFLVEQPVSFCVKGGMEGKLYRYSNYGFYTNQSTTESVAGVCGIIGPEADRCLPDYSAAPNKVLIMDSLDNTGLSAFTVSSQSLVRNSLIAINLNLVSGGDSIILNHEILTRSVP